MSLETFITSPPKTMKIIHAIAAVAVFCFSLVIVLLIAASGGIAHLRFDK